MPATGIYMSETVYHEDGYGNVTERIVVASSYANLFMKKADYLLSQPFTDILKIGSSKKNVSLETGTYAQDTLSIDMVQASIESQIDQNCYDLVLQSQDTAYPLYVAYFIQPDDTSDASIIATAEFVGIIDANMKGKEAFWRNLAEYSPDTKPLYEWQITAKSFTLSSFDKDKLTDLFDLMFADTSWRSTYIADREGWCDLSGGKITKFANLVNLNKVNKKLCDLLSARMSASLGITFTITIDECTLDVKFSPARWFNGNYGLVTRFIGQRDLGLLSDPYVPDPSNWNCPRASNPVGTSWSVTDAFFTDEHVVHYYKINANDQRTIKLGDSVSDNDSPWISSFMMFWNDVHAEDGSKQQSRSNSFVENEKITFAEYIIGIGATFGLFVKFDYSTPSDIHIKFISREGFAKDFCYVPDMTECGVSTSPFSKDTSKYAYGVACEWADEGKGQEYYLRNGATKDQSWFDYAVNTEKWSSGNIEAGSPREDAKDDKIFLTISPTVRCQDMAEMDDLPSMHELRLAWYLSWCRLPHNSFMTDTSGNRYYIKDKPSSLWNSIGLHTGIYLKCSAVEEVIHVGTYDENVGYGMGTRTIWTPAGAGHYKHDGTESTIYKLADYVNYIRGLEAKCFRSELTLTVPFLCRYRKAENGSDSDDDGGRGSWKNLELGSQIKFGEVGHEITYLVTGIERSSQQKDTKLVLWNSSAYSFASASGLTSSINFQGENNPPLISNTYDNSSYYVASGNINQLSVVILNDNGTVSTSTPTSTNIGKFIGISAYSALDGERIKILKPGSIFYDCDQDYAVRTPVYHRISPSVAGNIFPNILQEANGIEDVHLLIGYGTGTMIETINFDNIDNQIFLES